jgi:threonine dehydrogenase-like Zn-dependent dehydrogenase
MYGPGVVRVEERDEPRILAPTDAILRLPTTCICGSDLWPYRGIGDYGWPSPMGHEYAGIVEEVGDEVRTIRPGQFVVGSFFASDNTCALCRAGYQSSCVNREAVGAGGAQAELLRVPLADGTLVATPEPPPDELIPSNCRSTRPRPATERWTSGARSRSSCGSRKGSARFGQRSATAP